MEPTPRAGDTIPGKKMPKNVGPRTNHPVGKQCRMVRKNSQQTKRMGGDKNNVPKQCKRDEWGGSSEINIWAIITKTIMVEINVDNETALIHYPANNTTIGLNLRTKMQELKDMHAATHTKNPE